MAVGSRISNPQYQGYATHEVTDENVVDGSRQAAQLVKIVDDSGASASPATAANQTTGNTSLASIDGKLTTLVNQTDTLETLLGKSSTSNTPAIETGATALAANANRKQWSIQNVGTNPLFVRLGAGASATVFHFVLKGGTADNDGLGALLADNTWTGVVSIAGTSPKYAVTELT